MSTNNDGVSVDDVGRRVFWTQDTRVRSARLDGTDIREVATGSVPVGVFVDAASDRVFWSDIGTGLIEVSTRAGAGRITVASGIGEVHGFDFDSASRWCFWSDISDRFNNRFCEWVHLLHPVGGGTWAVPCKHRWQQHSFPFNFTWDIIRNCRRAIISISRTPRHRTRLGRGSRPKSIEHSMAASSALRAETLRYN